MTRHLSVLVTVLVVVWIKPCRAVPSMDPMVAQSDVSASFGGPGGNLADIYCAYCMRRGWMECVQRWCFRGRPGRGGGGFGFATGNTRGGSYVLPGGYLTAMDGSPIYQGGRFPGRTREFAYQGGMLRPRYSAQQFYNGRRSGGVRRNRRRDRMGSYYRPQYDPYGMGYGMGW